MTNPEHPCKGMSDAAIRAFEACATGNALPTADLRTMADLVKRGVVVKGEGKALRDEMGPFTLPQYFVPTPVHIQWCEWCSAVSLYDATPPDTDAERGGARD